MRWHDLSSLSLSLSLLLLTASAAEAQNLLQCGVHGIEGAIDVNGTSGASFRISDGLTGEVLWPQNGGWENLVESGSVVDYEIDTNSNTSVPYFLGGRLYVPDRLYVVSFRIPQSKYRINVAWSAGNIYPGNNPIPHQFYDPYASDASVDTCFKIVGSEVYVSTEDVDAATGLSGFLNATFGNVGWTMPYDAYSYCPAPCYNPSNGNYPTMSQFVSYRVAVQQGSLGPDALVPTFRFANDTAIPTAYGSQTWDVPGLVAQYAPGKSLIVNGDLSVIGASLQPANAASGWKGVRLDAGANGTFSGATISGVKAATSGYAVTVMDADLVLDGETQVDGLGGQGGVYAIGPTTDVVVSGGSRLWNHGNGYGLNVAVNARALVTGDATSIQGNASGGVRADASGTVIIAGGSMNGNLGPGAYASSGGTVIVRRGYAQAGGPPASANKITIASNHGGFVAEYDGEVVTCETSNDYLNNGGTSYPYDAYASYYSLVSAKNSYWGETARSAIGTVDVDYSTISIDPILTSPAGAQYVDVCGTSWKDGTGPPSVVGAALSDIIAEASHLRVNGQYARAAEVVASALATAETEKEFGQLGGSAIRIVDASPSRTDVAPVLGWAVSAAARNGVARPWAHRVLVAASRGQEAGSGATQASAGLLSATGPAANAHKLFAIRALVDRAVRAGDEEAAWVWVVRAEQISVTGSTELRRYVATAFENRTRGVVPGGNKLTEGLDESPAAQSSSLALRLAPNPASTWVEMTFAGSVLAADKISKVQVSVFDLRGRLVQTVTQGTMAPVRFDVRDLPAGTYVVRAEILHDEGRTFSAPSQFTVAR